MAHLSHALLRMALKVQLTAEARMAVSVSGSGSPGFRPMRGDSDPARRASTREGEKRDGGRAGKEGLSAEAAKEDRSGRLASAAHGEADRVNRGVADLRVGGAGVTEWIRADGLTLGILRECLAVAWQICFAMRESSVRRGGKVGRTREGAEGLRQRDWVKPEEGEVTPTEGRANRRAEGEQGENVSPGAASFCWNKAGPDVNGSVAAPCAGCAPCSEDVRFGHAMTLGTFYCLLRVWTLLLPRAPVPNPRPSKHDSFRCIYRPSSPPFCYPWSSPLSPPSCPSLVSPESSWRSQGASEVVWLKAALERACAATDEVVGGLPSAVYALAVFAGSGARTKRGSRFSPACDKRQSHIFGAPPGPAASANAGVKPLFKVRAGNMFSESSPVPGDMMEAAMAAGASAELIQLCSEFLERCCPSLPWRLLLTSAAAEAATVTLCRNLLVSPWGRVPLQPDELAESASGSQGPSLPSGASSTGAPSLSVEPCGVQGTVEASASDTSFADGAVEASQKTTGASGEECRERFAVQTSSCPGKPAQLRGFGGFLFISLPTLVAALEDFYGCVYAPLRVWASQEQNPKRKPESLQQRVSAEASEQQAPEREDGDDVYCSCPLGSCLDLYAHSKETRSLRAFELRSLASRAFSTLATLGGNTGLLALTIAHCPSSLVLRLLRVLVALACPPSRALLHAASAGQLRRTGPRHVVSVDGEVLKKAEIEKPKKLETADLSKEPRANAGTRISGIHDKVGISMASQKETGRTASGTPASSYEVDREEELGDEMLASIEKLTRFVLRPLRRMLLQIFLCVRRELLHAVAEGKEEQLRRRGAEEQRCIRQILSSSGRSRAGSVKERKTPRDVPAVGHIPDRYGTASENDDAVGATERRRRVAGGTVAGAARETEYSRRREIAGRGRGVQERPRPGTRAPSPFYVGPLSGEDESASYCSTEQDHTRDASPSVPLVQTGGGEDPGGVAASCVANQQESKVKYSRTRHSSCWAEPPPLRQKVRRHLDLLSDAIDLVFGALCSSPETLSLKPSLSPLSFLSDGREPGPCAFQGTSPSMERRSRSGLDIQVKCSHRLLSRVCELMVYQLLLLIKFRRQQLFVALLPFMAPGATICSTHGDSTPVVLLEMLDVFFLAVLPKLLAFSGQLTSCAVYADVVLALCTSSNPSASLFNVAGRREGLWWSRDAEPASSADGRSARSGHPVLTDTGEEDQGDATERVEPGETGKDGQRAGQEEAPRSKGDATAGVLVCWPDALPAILDAVQGGRQLTEKGRRVRRKSRRALTFSSSSSSSEEEEADGDRSWLEESLFVLPSPSRAYRRTEEEACSVYVIETRHPMTMVMDFCLHLDFTKLWGSRRRTLAAEADTREGTSEINGIPQYFASGSVTGGGDILNDASLSAAASLGFGGARLADAVLEDWFREESNMAGGEGAHRVKIRFDPRSNISDSGTELNVKVGARGLISCMQCSRVSSCRTCLNRGCPRR